MQFSKDVQFDLSPIEGLSLLIGGTIEGEINADEIIVQTIFLDDFVTWDCEPPEGKPEEMNIKSSRQDYYKRRLFEIIAKDNLDYAVTYPVGIESDLYEEYQQA